MSESTQQRRQHVTTHWRDHAQCLGVDPELWFPQPGDTRTRNAALAICNRCEVTTECENEATRLGVQYGIWGGEKRRLADGHLEPIELQPCGTPAALRRHQRRKQHCTKCVEADAVRRHVANERQRRRNAGQ